jgi:signal transduction histidine kinase
MTIFLKLLFDILLTLIFLILILPPLSLLSIYLTPLITVMNSASAEGEGERARARERERKRERERERERGRERERE